jgi:hypothetical protein
MFENFLEASFICTSMRFDISKHFLNKSHRYPQVPKLEALVILYTTAKHHQWRDKHWSSRFYPFGPRVELHATGIAQLGTLSQSGIS